MVRKVCGGVGEEGMSPVDSETNKQYFFSQPKEIRQFSTLAIVFYLSFSKDLELPSI